REVVGSRAPIIQLPLPQDDPRRRQPDISYARKQLNWEPRVPLRQGIQATVAYFDRLLSKSGIVPPDIREAI
ncbi:MAG TPA: hypothetical protein VMT54_20450, partial [Candidatus Cybelea sp.]|nr:hypothetical protein [Candidatus Cybelea sp.]